jgi:pimeloyl-ACP methyl ester carboxylesterase
MTGTAATAVELRPFHIDIPSWAERAYPNLIYFNVVDRGGHFAAWEQPELFSDELRKAFRSLRT